MKEVINIFKQLEATSSKIDKVRILNENADHLKLKLILEYTLNPFKIFGIGKKSIGAKKGLPMVDERDVPKDIFEMLNFLLNNNTGSDKVKAVVNAFLAGQTDDEKEWYTRIILKDLRIGAESSTVNKVFPDLIPVFDVMLATKWFDRVDKVKGSLIVTQKLDGIRCVIVKENGSIKLFSRQGQPFQGMSEIIAEAEKLPDNCIYDGELLLKNTDHLNSKDLYRATMKVVSKDGEKKNVEFHMFDVVPLEEFKKGESKDDCYTRKCYLHQILSENEFSYLIEVPVLYYGTNKDMVTFLLNEAIHCGQEGVMVNLAEGKYECKRSTNILKVKAMQSCDCKIHGFEEGDGRLGGTLGAILINYKGQNIVKVGSGYSDGDRTFIWANRDKLIGTIVEVQYFEETNNKKDDKISLRFPVFLRLRNDKTEESYN